MVNVRLESLKVGKEEKGIGRRQIFQILKQGDPILGFPRWLSEDIRCCWFWK